MNISFGQKIKRLKKHLPRGWWKWGQREWFCRQNSGSQQTFHEKIAQAEQKQKYWGMVAGELVGWTLKWGKRQDQNKAGRKSATKYLRKMRLRATDEPGRANEWQAWFRRKLANWREKTLQQAGQSKGNSPLSVDHVRRVLLPFWWRTWVNKKVSLGKYKLNDPDVSLTCKLESRKKSGGDCEERIRTLQE